MHDMFMSNCHFSAGSNANHAITNGVVTNMLAIYQEWHKYDHRGHKHMPARKSMLNILKHLTVSSLYFILNQNITLVYEQSILHCRER